MNLDDDKEVLDGAEGNSSASDDKSTDVRFSEDRPKESLKDQLKVSFKKHEDPANPRKKSIFNPDPEEKMGTADKSSGTEPKSAPAKNLSKEGKPPEAQADTLAQSQAATVEPAPEALSKETKAIWSTLPEQARKEFLKRETDTAKGVEQLKARYQPIDEALAPYLPGLQRLGKSPAEAVSTLFKWQDALASQNKAYALQAYRELGQSHGLINQQAAPSQQTGQQGIDPSHPILQQMQAMQNRLDQFENTNKQTEQQKIQSEIHTFASNPAHAHFEQVKESMGRIFMGGLAGSLDEAYEKACRLNPEVQATIQQQAEADRQAKAAAEVEAQREKDEKASKERAAKDAEALEKARKAGSSPRGTTPAGNRMHISAAQKGETIRDSIAKAVRQRSGSV